MPSQAIPINEVDKYGLIYDRPAVSLPPGAFSDALNVRFQDGTIRKMQGEINIFPNLFDDSNNLIGGTPANYDGSELKYVVYWPNPNIIADDSAYYLVITEESRLVSDDSVPGPGNVDPVHLRDIAYLVSVDGTSKVQKGVFSPVTFGNWQHTFFQGGFALIINNGTDKPAYILDGTDNTDINAVPNFLDLPGWDSYNLNRIALQDEFNPSVDNHIFDLGQTIDFDTVKLVVTRVNENDTTTVITLTAKGDTGVAGTANNTGYTPPDYSTITDTPWTVDDEYEIYQDSETGSTILNFPSNLSTDGIDTILVSIESRNPVLVTAGVIRSFGDFIVAGNLVERDETSPSTIIRSLPGVIRTSDVAAPGAMPNNWNPYASGVSTADEFIISETAPVKDMVEMLGNFYIYTSSSISVLRRTQNPSIPITITAVTDSYGCQNTDSVIEFEGKHLVVGSRDVYIFAGNPAGMQSVANDRVRRYLFNNLNASNSDKLFVIDYKQREEIWICYPSNQSSDGTCDEALIWSYRTNTWTRRTLRGVVSGTTGAIPGGGLPEATLTFTGVSGDNGVTHVGAYEVRTLGTPAAVDFINPSGGVVFYDGTIYTGVDAATFYTQVAELDYPNITIDGPEGISLTFDLTPDVNGDVLAQDAWDQIQAQIETATGWTFDTLPSGYTQETGTVRLIATEDDGSVDGLRRVEDVPFTLTINNPTEVISAPVNATYVIDFTMEESTVDATVQGVTIDSTNDYRGEYIRRAIPSVVALRLLNPNVTGGEEMLFISVGDTGDYDPSTHTGTNGVTYSADQVKDAIINKIDLAVPSLIAADGGLGIVGITPAGFAGASGILEDVRVNDTAEDAAWIWSKWEAANAGTITLNGFSDNVFTNLVDINDTYEDLGVATNSPGVAGSLDSQASPDGSRTPDRSGDDTDATLAVSTDNNIVYDVDRPWRTSAINPNREFPIFASYQFVDNVADSERSRINKIIAADIGFSVPAVSLAPRVETEDNENAAIVITQNDAPTAYESFIERKQFNITPDLDVESIKQFVIWASGSYTPYIEGTPLYNRLQLRLKATDQPGFDVDLSTRGVANSSTNNFFVSESYKADLRTTGRFLNLRLTDKILDADNNEIELTSNTKKSTSTVFSQQALWEVSGMQPEIGKGGGR